MNIGSGRQGGRGPPDIVDKGLIVLFFGLFLLFSVFFPLPPPPGNFSADALALKPRMSFMDTLKRICSVDSHHLQLAKVKVQYSVSNGKFLKLI